jgi:hypothetical protein
MAEDLLAQLVERWSNKPLVLGSIPIQIMMKFLHLVFFHVFHFCIWIIFLYAAHMQVNNFFR